MKYRLLLSLVLLGTFFPAIVYAQQRTLNILYTGGLHGELEPCGCSPKTDFGGLPRLSGYIAENRKALSPYLLIDAGNFSGEDSPQGRLKVETMLKAFSIMKYNSVAILKKELSFKDDFISARIKEHKIPFVSNAPQYKKTISMSMDSFDINVSADPKKYKRGKINILLSDAPVSDLKLIDKWEVIILSSGEILEEPLMVNDTIIVTGYPKGKKLGVLTLQIDNSGKITDFRHRWQPLGNDIKEDQIVRNILNDYEAQVARLLKEAEKPLTETDFLGLVKCAECHQPFAESWKETRHAHAFSSLEKVGKSANPECLQCILRPLHCRKD